MKPITLKLKEFSLEISKEQAIRSGIMKHLFGNREIYEGIPKFGEKAAKIFESDMQNIKIEIKEITITSNNK